MEAIKRYTISEAADLLSVSTSSLRRWEREGRVTPDRTPGGDRRYTAEQIEALRNPYTQSATQGSAT